MTRIPTKPEDFHWEDGKSGFREALQFLIDTRNFVANLEVPEGEHYMQIAHSDDDKPVGGDPRRPAVLDASYPFFERHLLSISVPIWTPGQQLFEFSKRKMTWKEAFKKAIWPDTQINLETFKRNTGLTSMNLQAAFEKVLDAYGIKYRDTKIGFYEPEGTAYVETNLIHSADYEKGRKIIQAYVHGNAQTPEELQGDIAKALGQQGPQYSKPTI